MLFNSEIHNGIGGGSQQYPSADLDIVRYLISCNVLQGMQGMGLDSSLIARTIKLARSWTRYNGNWMDYV
jgi:hypothetical protein